MITVSHDNRMPCQPMAGEIEAQWTKKTSLRIGQIALSERNKGILRSTARHGDGGLCVCVFGTDILTGGTCQWF